MRKKAVLVHLNGLVRVTPLVGGYLKAYAEAEAEVREHWDIDLYSVYVRTPASEVLRHLVGAAPDVVGFSVYTWNVGLVTRLLPTLRGVLPPATRFILGGPEVMHCGDRYIEPAWENVASCNGEGEQTFRQFLLRATDVSADEVRPAFDGVGGLSFWRDGQWQTTPAHARMRDLSALPSPWLNDVFDDQQLADVALFETNRGCPFECAFCYWGGAVGARVNKLELERIKAELEHIAARRTKTLVLCDANFGMLPRDVEIAEHIATLRQRLRFPSRVCYSSAKNHSERAEQIATIFSAAGLLQNQSISLQTMSARALGLAKRDNIETETYFRLQRRLNEQHVPSFIELIWPLPGETLDSFEAGVDQLCAMGAQAFAIYPLLWLNNVGYAGKEEAYGVATMREDDPASGGRIVVRTHEVSFEDFLAGLDYATSVYLLHDCRGLYVTMHVLRALGLASHRDVFKAFAAWVDQAPENPMVRLWQRGRRRFEEMIKYEWTGELAFGALRERRAEFDRLLVAFVAAQGSWGSAADGAHAELVAAAVEFDLLSRPHVYLQTSLELDCELAHLNVTERRRRAWTVQSPFDFPALARKLRAGETLVPDDLARRPVAFRIVHEGRQSLLTAKSDAEHHWHCHQIVREIGTIEARYEPLSSASGAPANDQGG